MMSTMPQRICWEFDLCDAHVHVGRYKQWCFPPEYIVACMKRLNIKKWAVSSTSTPAKGFKTARAELEACMALAPGCAVPVLWVTPQMLQASRDLTQYDVMAYAALKVHGFDAWDAQQRGISRLCAIARERHWPVLFHTGGAKECEAGMYGNVCAAFPGVSVVLYHGRPVEQAIDVCKRFPNAWIETSFMPMTWIKRTVREVGPERILFGSDFPLDAVYYPQECATTRYRRRVRALRTAFGDRVMDKWSRNFAAVFNTGGG